MDALDEAVAAQRASGDEDFSMPSMQGYDEDWDALQYSTTSPSRRRHSDKLSFRRPPETRRQTYRACLSWASRPRLEIRTAL